MKDFAILAAKVVIIIAVARVIQQVASVPANVQRYLP